MTNQILTLDTEKLKKDIEKGLSNMNAKNKTMAASEIVGVSQMTIYQLSKGSFKSPSFNVVINVVRWLGNDLNEYIISQSI